jgi:hypothetical protein
MDLSRPLFSSLGLQAFVRLTSEALKAQSKSKEDIMVSGDSN